MTLNHRHQPIDVRLPAHGVFVLESHHAPGFRMAEQRHDFLEVFYLLQGAGVIWIDGTRHACRQGDVVVVPAGRTHRIEDEPTAPLSLYGICVAPQVWRHEPDLLEHVPTGRFEVGATLAAQVRADLRRLLFAQASNRPGSRVLIHGLALELLALLARSGGGNTARRPVPETGTTALRHSVETYLAELPRRFFEATDLDHTAAALGMSRRRFTQLFRELTGTTWANHLTRLRIEYACQLLRESPRGIVAVAFECGFEELSSFYRAFKRQTGQTPNAWRQCGVPTGPST